MIDRMAEFLGCPMVFTARIRRYAGSITEVGSGKPAIWIESVIVTDLYSETLSIPIADESQWDMPKGDREFDGESGDLIRFKAAVGSYTHGRLTGYHLTRVGNIELIERDPSLFPNETARVRWSGVTEAQRAYSLWPQVKPKEVLPEAESRPKAPRDTAYISDYRNNRKERKGSKIPLVARNESRYLNESDHVPDVSEESKADIARGCQSILQEMHDRIGRTIAMQKSR